MLLSVVSKAVEAWTGSAQTQQVTTKTIDKVVANFLIAAISVDLLVRFMAV
jgi:hypothetical protein